MAISYAKLRTGSRCTGLEGTTRRNPFGITMPFENLKSCLTCLVTEARVFKDQCACSTGWSGEQRTCTEASISRRFLHKAVELTHTAHGVLGPSIFVNKILHFLAERRNVLWAGSKIKEDVAQGLSRNQMVREGESGREGRTEDVVWIAAKLIPIRRWVKSCRFFNRGGAASRSHEIRSFCMVGYGEWQLSESAGR
jgi:hypothetical protein